MVQSVRIPGFATSSKVLVGAVVLSLLACQAEPADPEERLREIRALHAERRYQETVQPLGALLDERPDDLELNRLYGNALFASESPGLAIWPFRRAAEHPDHSIDDLVSLANALGQGGAPEDGVRTAERILELDPDNEDALLLRAGVSLELRHFEDVLESAGRLVKIAPDRPLVHLWRAKAFAALDRFDEADGALEAAEAAAAGRRDAAALQQVLCRSAAEITAERGDDEQTEERWSACVERWPGSPELVVAAVDFLDGLGAHERATALLERSLESRPGEIAIRRQLAHRLESSGREEEAEALLREATGVDGIEQTAWLGLAELYRNRGDHAAAVEATERVLEGRETVPSVLLAQYADDLVQADALEKAEEIIGLLDRPEYVALLRGRLLLARSEPEAALEAFEEGLRLWPANGTARWLAGRAAEKLGDFDRAVAEYRDAVRGDSEGPDAALTLARLYAEEGNVGGALYVLGLHTRREPGDLEANLEIVRIAAKAGVYPAAEQALEVLRTLPGRDVDAALAAATITAAREGPSAAVEQLEGADFDLTSAGSVELLRALTGYQIEAHRAEDAVRQARAAVEAQPDVAGLHEILGRALAAAERPPADVRIVFERARALDPESVAAHFGLARLAGAEGDVDGALALYDAAIALDPENPEIAWSAIELLADTDRSAEADDRLEDLLSAQPRHVRAASLLARRLVSRGTESDLERAADLARRAVRFRGGVEALETMGLVATARGETARAARSLRLALELRPDSPSLRYRLALALEAEGERAGAAEMLRAALASGDFPEAEVARETLMRLEAGGSDG